MTHLLPHLSGGLRLISTSAVAYFTSAVLPRWAAVLIELAVPTLMAVIVNTMLTILINTAEQTADAIIFAIKNFVVIPLFVMTMLSSIRAVPPA